MNLRAAIEIVNKNIGVSILGIGYSIILFYILIFGVLGIGIIFYDYYRINLGILELLGLAIILFFPGYMYSQMDLFNRIITKQPKSFNAMTDIMIIESMKAIPISIVKLLILLILSIPSILLITFFSLELPLLIIIVLNLLMANIISEYLTSYSYYFMFTKKLNVLQSLKTGIQISVKTILMNLPIFSLYYLIVIIQLLPVINIVFLLWLPVFHVYIVGNFRKNASAGI